MIGMYAAEMNPQLVLHATEVADYKVSGTFERNGGGLRLWIEEGVDKSSGELLKYRPIVRSRAHLTHTHTYHTPHTMHYHIYSTMHQPRDAA